MFLVFLYYLNCFKQVFRKMRHSQKYLNRRRIQIK